MDEGTPFGRYRLVSLLGRGGMGEVWRAFDTETNREVAIKVLPAQLADDPQFEHRFRREALAAACLTEPHVIPIHNFGEIDGRLFVDMRLISGRDLQSVLHDGPLDPQRAIKIVDQIASALQAAHDVGLVHRDVKPANILITGDDFAYLIDFGIARTAADTGVTATGAAVGTWAYMSPERLKAGQIDPRSDVYALACVLYECLTAQRPYPGDSFEQLATAHLFTPPPRPSFSVKGVPQRLDDVIATGMAKDPEDRFATTRELARAADEAMRGNASAAPPPPPPPPAHEQPQPASQPQLPAYAPPPGPPPQTPPPYPAMPPPERRSRTPWLVGGIVAVVVVGLVIAGIVGLSYAWRQVTKPPPVPSIAYPSFPSIAVPSFSVPSGTAPNTPSLGGTAKVLIDGQDQNVDGTVVCTNYGKEINLVIGGAAAGIAVTLTDTDPPEVKSVALGNVNGLSLSYQETTATEKATVTKSGTTYTVRGKAEGVDIANPLDQVTKTFEIEVNCSG